MRQTTRLLMIYTTSIPDRFVNAARHLAILEQPPFTSAHSARSFSIYTWNHIAMAAKTAPAPRPPAFIEDAAPLKEATVVLAAPPDGLVTPEVALAKPLDGLLVMAGVVYGALGPAVFALKMLAASLSMLLR